MLELLLLPPEHIGMTLAAYNLDKVPAYYPEEIHGQETWGLIIHHILAAFSKDIRLKMQRQVMYPGVTKKQQTMLRTLA